MRFPSTYNPLTEYYYQQVNRGEDEEKQIEQPIQPPVVPATEVGVTIVDMPSRQNLVGEAQAAIRKGTSKIELQTSQGGPGQGSGFTSYGTEARQALREIQEANQVEFTSVHIPSSIGNMSGWGERGFDDAQRKMTLQEVKSAINFAADVNRGGAVVVHTGEFTRPISEQAWAKREGDEEQYQFVGYPEEPGRAILPIVDMRTGEFIGGLRKSQIYRMPEYVKAEKDGRVYDKKNERWVEVKKGDMIDSEGIPINPFDLDAHRRRQPVWDPERQVFKSVPLTWDEVEDVRKNWMERWEKESGSFTLPKTAEEMALQVQLSNQYASARGSALFYSRNYQEARKRWNRLKKEYERQKEIEGALPEDEKWRESVTSSSDRLGLMPSETRMKSEILKEQIEEVEDHIEQIYQSSSSSDVNAEEVLDRMRWAAPAEGYAMEKTTQTLAEAGIHAWQQTEKNNLKRDVFVAPENIFPQQFGSHPEELIRIVSDSRNRMVELMTSPEIQDPHSRLDPKTKAIRKISNPYRIPGMTQKRAEKLAEDHIKATIDTEHVGFWKAHWVPKPGQTKEEVDKEFTQWYLDQMEKLAESGIVGHMHFLDSIEGGHQHLPPGQGELPLKEAVQKLKESIKTKGGRFSLISEGFADNMRFGAARQLTEAWKVLGSPVYSTQFGPQGVPTFGQIEHAYGYFTKPPFYIVGAYSPSNDWKLWTEVPFE